MGEYQLIEYRPNRWIKIDPRAGVVRPATAQEVAAWLKEQEAKSAGEDPPEQKGVAPAADPMTPEPATPEPATPEPGPEPSKSDGHGAPQKPSPKPEPVKPPQPAQRDRVRPLPGHRRVTSTFKDHRSRRPPSTAPGIDLACPRGTEVRAWAAGKVIRACRSEAGGLSVWILHDGGIRTYYAHLRAVSVREGETVAAGQKIAESGNTGHSTGPHLHFAMVRNGAYVDPAPYLPAEERVTA